MYYMNRKELVKKTKKINYLIFSEIQETKEMMSDNFESIDDDLIEQAYLMSKDDRKRIISECIVQSLGFESLPHYSQKTRFLIDINQMRRYQDLEYSILKNVFSNLKESITTSLKFKDPNFLTFEWFFDEELKDRISPLKNRFKKTEKEKHEILNCLVAYTNQKLKNDNIPEGDFIIKENKSLKYSQLENFVLRFIEISNVNNQLLKNKKRKIDLVLKDIKILHPFVDIDFLHNIKYSISIKNIINNIGLLQDKEKDILIQSIDKAEMWDLHSLLSENENREYNSSFNDFISIFNECFLNEDNYNLNSENIRHFGNLIVEKYY